MISNIYIVKQHGYIFIQQIFIKLFLGARHCVSSWGYGEGKDRPHEAYSLVGKKIVTSNYKCDVCFKEVVCCASYSGVLHLGY